MSQITNKESYKYSDITGKIIGCAMEVHRYRLSSSYGDKQDLLKGGKGERVRGKGVLMTRSITV